MSMTSFMAQPEDTLLTMTTEMGKSGISAFKRFQRKWHDRLTKPALASLSDHTLREIGIHRSEISVIKQEGIGLSGARYYR